MSSPNRHPSSSRRLELSSYGLSSSSSSSSSGRSSSTSKKGVTTSPSSCRTSVGSPFSPSSGGGVFSSDDSFTWCGEASPSYGFLSPWRKWRGSVRTTTSSTIRPNNRDKKQETRLDHSTCSDQVVYEKLVGTENGSQKLLPHQFHQLSPPSIPKYVQIIPQGIVTKTSSCSSFYNPLRTTTSDPFVLSAAGGTGSGPLSGSGSGSHSCPFISPLYYSSSSLFSKAPQLSLPHYLPPSFLFMEEPRRSFHKLQFLRKQLEFVKNEIKVDWFLLGKTVGTGSFGRVRIAQIKSDILRQKPFLLRRRRRRQSNHADPSTTSTTTTSSTNNNILSSSSSSCNHHDYNNISTTMTTTTTTSPGPPAVDLLSSFGDDAFNRLVDEIHNIVFVLKILNKSKLAKVKQVEHIRNEKQTLSTTSHPFIVSLIATFQDTRKLYLLMEYVNGGELFKHLRVNTKITITAARFYGAEIVTVLQYLHSQNIVFRDLKPENLLIDNTGHIKVVDFGFAKYLDKTSLAFTLCGTHEYLAPETVMQRGHTKAVDWWALGILLFEMLVGHPPFCDSTPLGIYKRILSGKIQFPDNFDNTAKSLIRRLLHLSPERRLGCLRNGTSDVLSHRFFSGIDWNKCLQKNLEPPFIPNVSGPLDATMFDDYPDSIEDKQNYLPSNLDQEYFGDF